MPIVQPRSVVLCSFLQMPYTPILFHLKIDLLQTLVHSVPQLVVVVYGPSRQDVFSFLSRTPSFRSLLSSVVVVIMSAYLRLTDKTVRVISIYSML